MKMENSPDKLRQSCYNSATSITISSSAKQAIKRLKPATDSDQPELVRCKRRIHFSNLGYTLAQPAPQQVARRNERERNRVKLVNNGFNSLRQQLPNGVNNKKMSKVETLRSAVEYIRQLQTLLDENDAVNAVFSQNGSLSPACSLPSSEAASETSSSSPDSPPLTPEEAELLDFQNWF